MSKKTTVELGDKTKDLVSGFKGVVTSITSYLNGCDRCGVTSKITKDKKSQCEFFDINQLSVVKKSVVVISLIPKSAKPGGPRENEQRSGI